MKQFKKLVAALLVGVMALALFTACSRPAPSEAELAEAAIMETINAKRGEEEPLENTLKSLAKAALTKIDKNGEIALGEAVTVDNRFGTSENKTTMTIVLTKGFNINNIPMQSTSVTLNAMRFNDSGVMDQVKGMAWLAPYMSKFGVAADQQTGFVAVAFEIDYNQLSAHAAAIVKAWIGAHTPVPYV